MLAEAWIVFTVTAYSWGCGTYAHGITRSGRPAVPYWTAAADPRVLPLGTVIAVEGASPAGRTWHVEDTGRLIKGHRLDLFVGSCRQARQFGKKQLRVKVVRKP
jgi:3D (Asp-Asp-Asp) domain-containing protein